MSGRIGSYRYRLDDGETLRGRILQVSPDIFGRPGEQAPGRITKPEEGCSILSYQAMTIWAYFQGSGGGCQLLRCCGSMTESSRKYPRHNLSQSDIHQMTLSGVVTPKLSQTHAAGTAPIRAATRRSAECCSLRTSPLLPGRSSETRSAPPSPACPS